MLGVSEKPVNKLTAPVVLAAGVKLLRVIVNVVPVRSRLAEALLSVEVNSKLVALASAANAAEATTASSNDKIRDLVIRVQPFQLRRPGGRTFKLNPLSKASRAEKEKEPTVSANKPTLREKIPTTLV